MFVITSLCPLESEKKWVHFFFYFLTLSHTRKLLFLLGQSQFWKIHERPLWGLESLAQYIHLGLNHRIMNNSGGNDWTSIFIENWHFLNMKLFLFLCKWSSAFRCSGFCSFYKLCLIEIKRSYHQFLLFPTPIL